MQVALNPHMFRAYDIRGVVGDDLNPQTAEVLGRAYGTYLQQISGRRLAVGRDNRLSSRELQEAVIRGLVSTGCEVTDIDLAMSPMLYFAVAHWGLDGGINITGSHNPVQYNGLKLVAQGALAIAEEQIQEVRRIAEGSRFAQGQGSVRTQSVAPEYADYLAREGTLARPLKVAVDCGNGTASLFSTQILERIGTQVVPLYCESDGSFPHHLPDPEMEENTADLRRAVVEQHCDLGIAFDGDGDRLGLIDEQGHHQEADRVLMLLARDFLSRHPGERVMMDVKSSHTLVDDIRKHGGVPFMWKTGHSLAKRKMKEEGIMLAGEVSGHMFFSENYFGFDDATLAAVRLLLILAKSTQPVSAHWADVPKTYATPELKAPTPDDAKFHVVAEVAAYFKARYPTLDIDGVRITFPDGWALVRASNTNPYLTLRFESNTPEGLAQMCRVVYGKLREYPQVTLPEGCSPQEP